MRGGNQVLTPMGNCLSKLYIFLNFLSFLHFPLENHKFITPKSSHGKVSVSTALLPEQGGVSYQTEDR